MKKEEIIKGNILIALFMGYTERFDLRTDGKPKYQAPITGDATHSMAYSAEELEHSMELEFHKSWDWLMPVVEKIEQNHFVDIPTLLFGNYSCKIMKLDRKEFPKYEGWEAGDNQIYTNSTSKIEAVFKAVVEFIKTKK